ncbi:MAG: phytanoyl-CoA dioxygenase [Ilumatobacteraceae bacterium]|jgi:ectoine hydroxylase-related dioxygenase (phytanoyl-CoA dioxygenase family)|nr:phytanoyl-CoA dioxygenase [Ilumatobacteraceae bacterium]
MIVPLKHLPSDVSRDELVWAIRADGYAIVDNLVDNEVMDRVAAELEPYIDSTPEGLDNFVGKKTRRTGSLIHRSPASRELVMHPLVIGAAESFLDHATAFQLHLTQVISILPGETVQPIHRDQLAWDFFPFPPDYEVQFNTIWAMTDFFEENGATRVAPGSQLLPDGAVIDIDGTEPVEMKRGSCLFYSGKIYHGGGPNRSNTVRQGINITYAVGWVRQEENQYLSTPLEVARTLDEDLLRVMGYRQGCFALGYVGDFADPMSVITGERLDGLTLSAMDRVTEGATSFYESHEVNS